MVWFTDEAIAAWQAAPRTTRGGQPWYSPLAILTALTLRAMLRLCQSAVNLAVFDIGSGGVLVMLTSVAAGVVDQVLGTFAITSSTVIGTAAPPRCAARRTGFAARGPFRTWRVSISPRLN